MPSRASSFGLHSLLVPALLPVHRLLGLLRCRPPIDVSHEGSESIQSSAQCRMVPHRLPVIRRWFSEGHIMVEHQGLGTIDADRPIAWIGDYLCWPLANRGRGIKFVLTVRALRCWQSDVEQPQGASQG